MTRGKKTHGLTRCDHHKTHLYAVWIAMKQRCMNPQAANYFRYGGRGIQVCADWMDYLTFHQWAVAHGYQAGLTIERMENEGNYEPGNCRWATWAEQSNNKRTNVHLMFNGVSRTFGQWANITGINRRTIQSRVQHGWPTARALCQGVK
jgi:hypothetical protein